MYRESTLKFATDRGIIIGSALLFAFSGLNAAFTLWALTIKLIQKSNPMANLVSVESPFAVILLKLVILSTLVSYLWQRRTRDPLLVTLALTISISMYVLVTGLQVYWAMLFGVLK